MCYLELLYYLYSYTLWLKFLKVTYVEKKMQFLSSD